MRDAVIVAYMSTTIVRRSVRRDTLESLRDSDWRAEPIQVLNQDRYPGRRGMLSTDNAREALERAAGTDGWDLLLFLEDDLVFNRHLRHNLQRWPPIVDLAPDGHFCGSLYDPNIGSLDPAQDGETHRVAHPELPYGSQAVLFSRPTLAFVLDGWHRFDALSDLKMFRLAARVTPIHYHLPSLVQHRPVPSLWGGVPHSADNFSIDFPRPVTVVLVVPAAPADTGNGLAMRAGLLLEALAAVTTVDVVIVPISGPSTATDWARSRSRRILTVEIPTDPATARGHTHAQLADTTLRERLVGSQPLPDRARRVPPTLAERIASDLHPLEQDCVVVTMREYLVPFGAWLARLVGARRSVVDLDDDAEAVLRQLGQSDEAAAYGRLAGAWLGDADTITAASADEAAAMADRYGVRIDTVPNAVRLPGGTSAPPRHDRLLFVGNLTYQPNVAAARELVDDVFPEVRRRRPNATVTLVGHHDDRLDALVGLDGVTLAGAVAEVTTWHHDADVVVVPLRAGAGTRIKVLEALAHGRPVVSTAIGVAGLGLRAGHDVEVAEDPVAIAAATVRLLEDEERWQTMAAAGFATVARTHTVDAVAPRVRRVLLGPPDVPPARSPAT